MFLSSLWKSLRYNLKFCVKRSTYVRNLHLSLHKSVKIAVGCATMLFQKY
ncbi:hypothetical protein Gohar_026674 [Gossypium harknessii]|uniref:Uncharacterized protein n=1 Tax=Gossypium harknessii TaxID=34285 RepID=A0A7J9HV20_9ROSI|nr:hypothetical protein [Gossypium harknessii]